MNENIALRVKLRRLLAALQRQDFRQDVLHQAGVHQQVKAAHAVLVQHDFDELIADALDAHAGDFIRQAAHRFPGGMLDVKTEHRGEANCPHQPQPVLLETLRRHADGSQQAHLEVFFTSHIIDDLLCQRIVKKAIHREVTPLGIHLRRGKGHAVRSATIRVAPITAKRGHLDETMLSGPHHHHAEVRSHGLRPREKLHDLLRSGTGGHIVVLRLAAQQHVTHTTTRQQRGVPRGGEFLDDPDGCLSHVPILARHASFATVAFKPLNKPGSPARHSRTAHHCGR